MLKSENINDRIFLYNGDCMDLFKTIDDNSIDLIITDPPYKTTSRGCAGNSGGMLQKDINKKGQVFENNVIDIKTWLPPCYKALKETGHFYIMTNHKNLHEYLNAAEENGLHFIKSIIWNKGNKIMGQYYMSQFEYILFFRKGAGVKINNCGTADILNICCDTEDVHNVCDALDILNIPNKKPKGEDGKNLHDTYKPTELWQVLIENSSKENDIVLDPFGGVFSSARACIKTNRKFKGSELDEIYFKIGADLTKKEMPGINITQEVIKEAIKENIEVKGNEDFVF